MESLGFDCNSTREEIAACLDAMLKKNKDLWDKKKAIAREHAKKKKAAPHARG